MVNFEYNDLLKEGCKTYTHKTGITISVIEKPEFNTTYAVCGTRYGSIDNAFKIKGENDFTVLPEGIAHFLEHKLFENEDIDVFERFSKVGASSNAFTSFDRTCYYFSTTSDFDSAFEILLDFVQKPYFTKETVEKEQGIIGQEISMYDDQPFWMLYFQMLGAMYHINPIKINICGTRDSIAKITPELLYKCYQTYYNPANMYICVCGKVNAEHVFELADKFLKDTPALEFEKFVPDEPDTIVCDKTTFEMPIAKPLVALGYKETLPNGKISIEEALAYDLIRMMYFNPDSDFGIDLLEKGIVGRSFGSEYSFGNGYSFNMIYADTDNPEKFVECITQKIDDLHKNGLDRDIFERMKKVGYATIVCMYDDIENIALNIMLDNAVNNYSPFEMVEAYKNITFEYVSDIFEKSFRNDRSVNSIINPIEVK